MTREEKLTYFINKDDEPSINNGNSKTGPDCFTLSMPQQTTCSDDLPCKKAGCYCSKGCQKFVQVEGAYYKNYRLWTTQPKEFEAKIDTFVKKKKMKLFRYNDAGDIPDIEYLRMMTRIAQGNPETKFLAYTKKYNIVNEYLDAGETFPSNLCIRFSYWDKTWPVPNPHNLPVAYVDFTDKEINPEFPEHNAICPGRIVSCSKCQICFNNKIQSVVFHQH